MVTPHPPKKKKYFKHIYFFKCVCVCTCIILFWMMIDLWSYLNSFSPKFDKIVNIVLKHLYGLGIIYACGGGGNCQNTCVC